MKKLFLVLVPLFFIFSAVTAQNKDTSSNVYNSMKKNVKDIAQGVTSDTKSLLGSADSGFAKLADSSKVSLGSVYSDIKTGIEGMAAALKVGAAHVYAVLVRQQIAKSVMILLVLITGIILLRLAWKTSKSENWDEESNPQNGMAILNIVFWVIGTICIIYFVCRSQTFVTGFINPEFGAMNDIVDFVKEIRGK